MDSILVRHIHGSLFQEASSTVRDHAISFHLSESETTISGSTLSWLSCQDLGWTSSSRVHLISDHMLKSLIVSWTQEDEHFLFLSCETVVHNLITVSLVTQVMELISNFRNLLATERSGISSCAIKRRFLGQEALNQMTNCHTRWNSVRVDDQVWNNTFSCEREVFLSVCHSTCSFLSMSRGKLISDLRSLDCSHLDLDE
jgi:hypothetical protein